MGARAVPVLAWVGVLCLWLSAASVAQEVLLPNPGFEVATAEGLPEDWGLYQWGPTGSAYGVTVEGGVGREGSAALRAENLEPAAKAGVYTHVPLEPGTYRLSVWARTAGPERAAAALYLGTAYSPPLEVSTEWQRLEFANVVEEAIERAEINIQNASGVANVVWFDDIELRQVPAGSVPEMGFEPFAQEGEGPAEAPWVPYLLDRFTRWHPYQWGTSESAFRVTVHKGAGLDGSAALRARNLDPAARAGAYTHLPLEAGRYRLTVWARAAEGESARARVYLASAYSWPFWLSEEWRQLSFTHLVAEPIERAEINIQNMSGAANSVWFDEVSLERLPVLGYELVPDTRESRPGTLAFCAINVNYLRESAPMWAERGFRGFLLGGIMPSWISDVWATDGDPGTRHGNDALLREVRACNRACRKAGIDCNFLKVAFYDELPHPFDEAAWERLTENFRQGARFARMAHCAGVAIDTEYVSYQYEPSWEGYGDARDDLPALKAAIRCRWRDVVGAMLAEYPRMVLVTLPEGMFYYGELYADVFTGMLEACAERDAPGGLHLLTEGTYHLTDPLALSEYPAHVQEAVAQACSEFLLDYWRRRCSVAMGAWPLGYYRAVYDEDGNFLGYSGKEGTFGDEIVGSYADKSEWYGPEEFGRQMAGLNTFCPRYNWIYMHGTSWWQNTAEEIARYQQCAHKMIGNAALPTVENLQAYCECVADPMVILLRPAQ